MIKIVFTLIMMFSLGFSIEAKPTGCELSQVGDVSLSFGKPANTFKVNYNPIAKSGKNFRSILVGSVLSLKSKNIELKILDIKANKRVKRGPRTGMLSVVLNTQSGSEKIAMKYHYNKGSFVAKGIQKNSNEISFALDIEALLCHAK